MCLQCLNSIGKERATAVPMLPFPVLHTLPVLSSVWVWPIGYYSCYSGGWVCWLWASSCAGNNVMRTIHGVGEMMTQMVLSRGSIFPMSVPDVQPSIHPSKQGSPAEQEDVTVMDTKLKIIEILQVSCLMKVRWPIPNCTDWFNFLYFLLQIIL